MMHPAHADTDRLYYKQVTRVQALASVDTREVELGTLASVHDLEWQSAEPTST